MIEILFPVVTLGGLALFILWESWQRRESTSKPLSRALMERGFEPGASNKVNVLLTLGIVGISFSLFLFNSPPHPPFTGRGSIISSVLFATFGPLGIPVLILALSVAAFIGCYVVRRKRLVKEQRWHAS